MQSLLDYALAYAELGWSVFPCHAPIKKDGWNCSCEAWKRKHNPDYECSRPGKHPRTKNGLDDATIEPEQIKAWWKKWPTANIGINCGASGLLVVDLDTYKDIYEGDDLELNEETVTGLSGGGGAHLFYKMEQCDTFGNSDKGIPDGVDIRGIGGYVVVAPSNHESGGVYQWELDYSPWDRQPSSIPPKLRTLLEAIQEAKRSTPIIEFDTTKKYTNQGTIYGLAALNKQCQAVSTAANGTRNNTLNTAAFSLARLVAGGELDYNYAYDNLYAAALGADLSDAEAKQTIESGMEAGAKHPYSTVTIEDGYDGFGECPDPIDWFGPATPLTEDDIVKPVHLAEIQDAIESLFKAGNPLEVIREKHWRAIGNLSIADRRLLSTFMFNLGLFSSVKQAGTFIDGCATSLDTVPLIERITNAIESLGHNFRLNVLEDEIEVDGKRLDDTFMSEVYLLMEDKKFRRNQVDDAVNILARRNSYHPVKDYLLNLQWDGEDHLTKFLKYIRDDGREIVYPDGSSTPLYKALFKRWMIGCVARALDGDNEDAFKHQTPVIVLMGAQGKGKSSMIRWLASGIGYRYHREGPINPHDINHIRSAVKVWIWEISELGSSLRRSDRDAFKSFITQEWHTYKKPYAKYDIVKPALCNFAGTLNPDSGFLDDPTGHRRFLPIAIEDIDHGYADKVDVNQLWAQIVAMYMMNESPELSSFEKEAMKEVYEENEIENPLRTYMAMYFSIYREDESIRCTTAEIITRLRHFGVNIHPDVKVSGKQISEALMPMGLKPKRWTINGEKVSGWVGIQANNKTPLSQRF